MRMNFTIERDDPPAGCYARRQQLEGGELVNRETGEFPMILASEGEASDGHILSLDGLELPETLPLQVDHSSSSLGNVGQISGFRIQAATATRPRTLHAVGQIRLTGEGDDLVRRRDLLDAIAVRDIRGVSLSWRVMEATERRDLPKTHFAHVPRSEKNPRRRYGLFFGKTTAREGSITPLPSDLTSIIGRAEHSAGPAAELWFDVLGDRSEATDLPPEVVARYDSIIETLEGRIVDLESRSADIAPDPAADSGETPDPATFDRFCAQLISRVETIVAAQDEAYAGQIRELIARVERSLS